MSRSPDSPNLGFALRPSIARFLNNRKLPAVHFTARFSTDDADRRHGFILHQIQVNMGRCASLKLLCITLAVCCHMSVLSVVLEVCMCVHVCCSSHVEAKYAPEYCLR